MTEKQNNKVHDDSAREKLAHQAKSRHWFQPLTTDNDDALSIWRETILFTVLATTLTLSLSAFIPGIIIGYREGLWGLIVVDTAVYLGTCFLFIFRSLRYDFRAGAAVLLIYVVGLNVCLQVGILSGGPVYIFTGAILAGLLIGLKGAAATVVLNALTIVVLGYLHAHGQFDGQQPYFATTPRALAAGASFILLNAVSAISAAVMVRGLHHATAKQTELTQALYREKADLIATRRELKAENEERKNSEQALRESEAKYRLLAENIHDVIFTLDLDLNYTYVSPAVERLQGWQPHEIISLNVAATLPGKSLELAADTLQAELALAEATGNGNRSAVLEIELLHKDGSTVWGEVTAAFLLDDNGKPSGVLGVSRDISERRKAQQEREELHEQLARSKKMEA
ncbi:MAG: PAS domain S-box protein, partial [Desulfobacteraceae bacterium]